MVEGVTADAERIVRVLRGYRYVYQNERELQDGIGSVLGRVCPDLRREVQLSAADRIDFMAGRVGIEVKIKGSPAALLRQVHRYAEHEDVGAIVIVTSRVNHLDLPDQISGKPVFTFTPLLGSAF